MTTTDQAAPPTTARDHAIATLGEAIIFHPARSRPFLVAEAVTALAMYSAAESEARAQDFLDERGKLDEIVRETNAELRRTVALLARVLLLHLADGFASLDDDDLAALHDVVDESLRVAPRPAPVDR